MSTYAPFAKPLYVRINTVTCHARCILDDRNIFSGKNIKECGFSHIRSADDRHYWFTHIFSSFLYFAVPVRNDFSVFRESGVFHCKLICPVFRSLLSRRFRIEDRIDKVISA